MAGVPAIRRAGVDRAGERHRGLAELSEQALAHEPLCREAHWRLDEARAHRRLGAQSGRRGRWICVPDYLFPVNHLGVWFLETFRSLGARLAAVFSAKVFDLLTNGDEVKAALKE